MQLYDLFEEGPNGGLRMRAAPWVIPEFIGAHNDDFATQSAKDKLYHKIIKMKNGGTCKLNSNGRHYVAKQAEGYCGPDEVCDRLTEGPEEDYGPFNPSTLLPISILGMPFEELEVPPYATLEEAEEDIQAIQDLKKQEKIQDIQEIQYLKHLKKQVKDLKKKAL